jgi:hypothetical protein
MTPTITETLGAGDTALGGPLHCGDPMILRETSYRAVGYGMIHQVPAGPDVELVWACSCGFQLSFAEPAELALPLPPALRRVATAAADLESVQWKFDQATTELEAAVLRASATGASIADIAEAAHLELEEVRELVSGGTLLSHVG